MPALRAHIAFTSDDRGRIQIATASLPTDLRPDAWPYLYGWLDDNWSLISIHGNADRDCVGLIEQRWGAPMRLVAVVTVKEKDDGTLKIKAVTDDVPGIPKDWDQGLYSWTKAGWDLVDITGNREHGTWWMFAKGTSDNDVAP